MKILSSGLSTAVARRENVKRLLLTGYLSIVQLRAFSLEAERPSSSSKDNMTVCKSEKISTVLSSPMWSIRSLLPTGVPSTEEEISPKRLHHLLRLSALPLPQSPEEEKRMIDVLQSQLHFVRDIKAVDTEGITPLSSIRDETEEGLSEVAIGVDQVSAALAEETIFGHTKRPRKQKRSESISLGTWDVLGTTSRKAGKYFVVKSGKD